MNNAEKICSLASRAYGEEPGGTASTWDRLLLIELPKPWPAEVVESQHFPEGVSEVLDRAEKRGAGVKLQCMEPDQEYSVEGHARVMFFSRPEGPFAAYRKDEFVVPADEIGALAEALVERPERMRLFESHRQDTTHIRDMLVCTHGIHDSCCGTYGYPVYDAIRSKYTADLDGAIRAWRVSHIGGHRFAPNLLDMPEGRNWVRLDLDSLRALVTRDGPVAELRPFHRGWAGVGGPYEQLAEQEAFMREGWDWARMLKSSRLLSSDDDGGQARVRIDFAAPDDDVSGAYEAEVGRTGHVVKANCLNVEDTDEIDQYAVSRLVRVS